MKDTLFVQFFTRVKHAYVDLCNGFSDVTDLCRQKGEFFWVEHEADRRRWNDESIYLQRKLPFARGTAYVSAVYTNHLYQAYIWARENPALKVVVGGPAAAECRVTEGEWHPVYVKPDPALRWPPNLIATGRSLESWFGVKDFSFPWRLDIPSAIAPQETIYFSYTLDNRCYWRRCIYCNIALHAPELFRERRHINCEFESLDHRGTKRVRLNTGSITPKFLREVLPMLPRRSDLDYRMFIRSGTPETRSLKEALQKMQGRIPDMVLGFGMEFPTNRMLRYAGKGFTTDELLAFLNTCGEYGLRVNANFMLGWNNLTENDIRELAEFMQRIPENVITTAQIRWLLAHPFTTIHDTYEGDPIWVGPFYEGFRVRVSEEQKALNRKALETVERCSALKHFKVQGLASIYQHL